MLTEETEKEIHQLFDFTLIVKGIHALFEIVGGCVLFFTSPERVIRFIDFFVYNERTEDPRGFLSHYFISLTQDFSASSKAFIVFYLLSHGIINSAVLYGLWKEKLWSYPFSLITLVGSIIYQVYRYTHTHSVWLIALSILDIILIFLVRHEYIIVKNRYQKRLR